jgi:hypothetical protein
MLNLSEMAATIRLLKAQMSTAGLLSATGAAERLDILIARLEVDDFLRLRTLPAFSALLSLWEIPADSEQTVTSQSEEREITRDDKQEDLSADEPALTPHTQAEAKSSVTGVTHRLPHPRTKIGDVQLGGRFDKLIARLCRSANSSVGVEVTIERLEDILNLPFESLFKLEGVGKAYRDDWQELKSLYIQADLAGVVEPVHIVRDDMRLNLTQLDVVDLKAIAKLERVVGRADIRTILSFDSIMQGTPSSLGARTRVQLLQVRERLVAELQLITAGTLNYHANPSSLITAPAQSFESIAALGKYLLDGLDTFLGTMDEKSQLIFQHRWGFVDERLTLSEIGKQFDVSRERIRQLAGKINEQLNNYIALDSDEIWCAATSLPEDALCLEMADLFECFGKQSYAHEFLEFVSHGRIAPIAYSIRPSLRILDEFFALHGTAIEQTLVLQHLQNQLGGEEEEASHALMFLQTQNQVALENGHVYPLNLGKHEAAAAVLSEHPSGLPWLDIARHANRRGISRSPFSEQIVSHGLQDSVLMYVAGKGVYRHTRFVDFSTVDEPTIFQALNTYFATSAREVSHLSEAYAGIPELRKYDYWIVRYVVKMHGEDHGIYFNGKSQADSISLNSAFDLYSQKNVILQSMRQSQGPLTSNEVAQLLKSRSSRHASVYLSELMVANQVVQVERMLYTTPEQAYKNIDLDTMQQAIAYVLRRHNKPVEPSIIQDELNALLEESYSKYFYSSLARYLVQHGHWHRRHSLFSLQPISFGSLTDAIDTLYNQEESIEQNVVTLRLHIAINEEAAKVSIYNWKAAKVRSAAGIGVPEVEDVLESELDGD